MVNDDDFNNNNKTNNIATKDDTWVDGNDDIGYAKNWDGTDYLNRQWRYYGFQIPKEMYDKISYRTCLHLI
jgi:hypothetical protein